MAAVRGNLAARIPRQRRTSDAQSALGPIEAMYEDAKSAMRQLALTCNESMAFYIGWQWGRSTEVGYEEDTGERQETYNYIQSVVRAWVASNLRAMPAPQVVASHSTWSSMQRARAGQMFVRSMLYDGTLATEELVRGEIGAAINGACWYKACWDPHGGRVVKTQKFNPREAPGPNGKPLIVWEPEFDYLGNPVMIEQFEGAIKIEARDIIDVLPDPNATREEEVGYIFERKAIARYRLEAMFQQDVYGEPTKGRFESMYRDEMMEQRDIIEKMTRGVSYFSSTGQAPENELCMMVSFWVKPNPIMPQGRLFIWSGDVILSDGPLPYEWPWVLRNGENIVPGSLYAIGSVDPLKSPQRTLNLNASKRSEIMEHCQQVNLLVDRQANVEVEAFTDISGNKIFYDGGRMPPTNLPAADIPPSMFEQEAALLSMLRDISSFHEIAQGDAPPQIETGRGLAYLFEFQQGVRAPSVAMFKNVIIRLLNKGMRLARDFFTEARTIDIIGEDLASWTIRSWKRTDYELDTQVRVLPDGDVPNSPALRLAMAQEFMTIGALSDTPEGQRFRKMVRFDWGSSAGFPNDRPRQYDRAVAQIELLRADPTTPLVPEPRDNADVFLEVLEQFWPTPEFDAMPPIAKTSFENYFYMFEQIVAQQQMDFARQQQLFSRMSTIKHSKEAPQQESPFDGGQSDMEGMQFEGSPEAAAIAPV